VGGDISAKKINHLIIIAFVILSKINAAVKQICILYTTQLIYVFAKQTKPSIKSYLVKTTDAEHNGECQG
jgi:uncharacterized membrane protein YqjE